MKNIPYTKNDVDKTQALLFVTQAMAWECFFSFASLTSLQMS